MSVPLFAANDDIIIITASRESVTCANAAQWLVAVCAHEFTWFFCSYVIQRATLIDNVSYSVDLLVSLFDCI